MPLLAVVFSVFGAAQAQNLVQDPGFESTYYNPDSLTYDNPYWNIGGNGTSFASCSGDGGAGQCSGVNQPLRDQPYNGNWYTSFGSTTVDAAYTSALTQVIPTVAGTTYLVSFFLANDDGPVDGDNFFLATLDGQTVLSLTNADVFNYTQFSALITATSDNATLSFVGEQMPAYFSLDDVSVTAEGAPAPTVGGGALSFVLLACAYAVRQQQRMASRRFAGQ